MGQQRGIFYFMRAVLIPLFQCTRECSTWSDYLQKFTAGLCAGYMAGRQRSDHGHHHQTNCLMEMRLATCLLQCAGVIEVTA
jgi:hypothetical protein